MEELPPPPQPRPFVWPPERGWPLFLAWMGGVLAAQIISQVILSAFLIRNGPQAFSPSEWSFRLQSTVVPFALYIWQAWLLFRGDRLRFAMWSALPLLGLILPHTIAVVGYMMLIVPLIEAAILRGVRQRAWAWILAGMAGVVLVQLGQWFTYGMGGSNSIANWVMKLIGNTSPGLRAQVPGILLRGVWIATEAISAAVLAWWMPRVAGHSPAPPTISAE